MKHDKISVELINAKNGLRKSFIKSNFPCSLSCWNNGPLKLDGDATHFGFVGSGSAILRRGSQTYHLSTGMYFSLPCELKSEAYIEGDGIGLVASRLAWQGLFSIGGPIEQTGRLHYIDGCSDTLLIGPPVLGDPCLNFLRIPPATEQTAHTHPSERIGMIASGSGICRSPSGDLTLEPGMIFYIAPDGLHSFHTTTSELLVIAWHPDSDCGPAHHDHPMINRTIINGVPAAELLLSRINERTANYEVPVMPK